MQLSEKQALFMDDVAKLIQYARSQGDYFTGGELHRTPEQQQIYYEQGKTKTHDSKHLKRLAIDLFLFKAGVVTWNGNDYKKYGEYWESLRPQNRWGGNFTGFVDAVHFEQNS